MWEVFKPLVLRFIGILLATAIVPVLQKAQAVGLLGEGETGQVVATLTAVLLAAIYFGYRRLESLAIHKVSLALPASENDGDLTVTQQRVREVVKAQPLAGKLEIIRSGASVGAAVTGGRGKTGQAFKVAALVLGALKK